LSFRKRKEGTKEKKKRRKKKHTDAIRTRKIKSRRTSGAFDITEI